MVVCDHDAKLSTRFADVFRSSGVAVKQVATPSFFALLVIAVSFLPVLTLEGEEGRLFKPLAYTKNLAILVAAIIAVTLDPALRMALASAARSATRSRWLARIAGAVGFGIIRQEDRHPVSRALMRLYGPAASWVLRNKALVLGGAMALMALTVPAYRRLGSELMPPLDEGVLLYMPSTMPGISASEAQRVLQTTDSILKQFPEVERVLGKAGRAETATDPAPLSMLETVVVLRPTAEWRYRPTWYSSWAPDMARALRFRRAEPHAGATSSRTHGGPCAALGLCSGPKETATP